MVIMEKLNTFSLKRLKDFLYLKLTEAEFAGTVQLFYSRSK